MSYIKNFFKSLIDKKHGPVVLFAIISLSFNMFTYCGTRLFMGAFHHYDMSIPPIDDIIPLIPWTNAIYLGCYAYWILNYVLACFQDKEETSRYWSADLFAKVICLAFFVFLPTTNVRPVVEPTGFWNKSIIWLYNTDPADNLFPSIHCLTSWFCVIAVRNQKWIPKWYKVVSVIIALAICVATLTTKQHVIVDTFAGVFLAEISYYFVKKSGLANLHLRLVSALDRRIRSNKPATSSQPLVTEKAA